MDINSYGTMDMTRAFVPRLAERHGTGRRRGWTTRMERRHTSAKRA